MVCKAYWEQEMREGNRLFNLGEFQDALAKYTQFMGPPFSLLDDTQPLCSSCLLLEIDRFIVTCHNICDCLIELQEFASVAKYAALPVSEIKVFMDRPDFSDTEDERLLHKISHCLTYYMALMKPCHPKFGKANVQSMVKDLNVMVSMQEMW